MTDHKLKSVLVVCGKCHKKVGNVTPNPQGIPIDVIHAIGSDCKHPPVYDCPSLQAAFSKAHAAMREVC